MGMPKEGVCVVCGRRYNRQARKYKPTCTLECGIKRYGKFMQAQFEAKAKIDKAEAKTKPR